MCINYFLPQALIFTPLSCSFACLLSGRWCIFSTYGMDFSLSWIFTHSITSSANLCSQTPILSHFHSLFLFLPPSNCFFLSRFHLSPPHLPSSHPPHSSTLCISLCFNLPQPQRYQPRKTRSPISIHSQRQTERPVQYQSGMRVAGSHKAPVQPTALGVKLKTRPP